MHAHTCIAVFNYYWTVTSIAAGRIGDTLGRRGTLFSGAVVFAVGGAIQTLTNGFTVMVVGRIVAGFGVGLLSFVDPDKTENHLSLRCLQGLLYRYTSPKFLLQTM